jgi:hypothetical protein
LFALAEELTEGDGSEHALRTASFFKKEKRTITLAIDSHNYCSIFGNKECMNKNK